MNSLERLEKFSLENPTHKHAFKYNPDTDKNHCSCGGWWSKLESSIHWIWDEGHSPDRGQNEKT